MRQTVPVLCLATLSIAGCAGVEVSEDKSLKGIPFYVKVPVATQDTVLSAGELVVSFTVSEIAQAGAASKVLRSVTLPHAGALRIPEGRRADLERILGKHLPDRSAVYENTLRDLSSIINDIAALAPAQSGPQSCANIPTLPITNSWSVSMVADTVPRYVVTKIPIMGSSTSNFKFAPDGTMSESSVAVADDTAKTLLALFPITEKLSKQWGVNEIEAEAKSPGTTEYALKSLPPVLGAKPKPTLSLSVKLATLMSQSSMLYTMRKVHRLAEGSSLDDYLKLKQNSAPLTLCQAMTGKNGVQLVSVTRQGSDSGKPETSPAWQIQDSGDCYATQD
jgi:hypothetical protein